MTGTTKINLIRQSDQTFLEPLGIKKSDLPDLVGDLEALSKTDGEIQDKLEQEVKRAGDAEGVLTADLSTEAATARAAEGVLTADLSAEAVRAIAAEDGLTADVATEKAAREAAVSTEKSRIDAILDASEADKDTFAEIVTLINSVDTESDEAFAGYVLSNNAALSSELVARAEGDSSLESKMNADVSTEKAGREAADDSLESKIDSDVSTEKAAREDADKSIDTQFLTFKSNVQTNTISIESRISTEEESREEADASLDTRINDTVFNATPGIDSMDEMITGFNEVIALNIETFYPRRTSVDAEDYDSEKGLVGMSTSYQPDSFMFFINGLMLEPGWDYNLNMEEDKSFLTISLLGDAKTLADNGSRMVEYGVNFIEGNIDQVVSGIVDPNGEPSTGVEERVVADKPKVDLGA